jgi:hypothetical protein
MAGVGAPWEAPWRARWRGMGGGRRRGVGGMARGARGAVGGGGCYGGKLNQAAPLFGLPGCCT